MKSHECLCGRGQECKALSFAFHVLEDPRSGYTSMPRMITSKNSSPALLLVSQLRDAYLRNLLSHHNSTPEHCAKVSKQTSKRQFVANHHFHPQIVLQSTKGRTCKIPWFIDEEMAQGLNLGLTEQDRVRDESGDATDEYFLAPTYNIERTKKDLQRLVRAEKKMSQAKNRVTTSKYSKPWNRDSGDDSINGHSGDDEDDLHSIGNDSILMNWEENCEKPFYEKGNKSPTGTAIELERSLGQDAFSASMDLIPPLANNASAPGSPSSPFTPRGTPMNHSQTTSTAVNPMPSVPDCVEINSYNGGTGDDLSIGMQGLPVEDPHQNSPPRTYDELLAFEAKRRTYYAETMSSVLQELHAAVKVLIEGKHETSKACRLVVASSLASQAYARDMDAIFQDCFVDDSCNIVTNPWQQNKLMKQRDPASILENNNSEGFFAGSGLECELLEKALEIQSSIGNAFADTTKHMNENIVKEFKEFEHDLFDSVEEKMEVAERLSDALINELKAIERDVQQSWAKLDGIACEELLGDATSECSHTSSQTSKNDLWLLEMYYRVSVSHLSSTWHMVTAEIQSFQQSIIDVERERRMRLHELLLEFQPRQKRLGNRAIAITQDPALQSLIDTSLQVSEEDIENEVKNAVQLQSKTIQKQQTEHRSSILNRTRRSLDYIGDSMAMDLGLEKLDPAVVDSQFVFASKVMERNNLEHATYGGISWDTTLAVITSNSYLHFFHIPQLGKDIGPEEAFRQWQAGVQMCELQGVWDHETDAGIKRLLKKVTPSESWFLPKCTVTYDSQHDTVFQIVESHVNVFGKSVISRKIELRTESAAATSHWIDTKMEPNMWGGNAGADIQRVGISAVEKAENLKLLPLTNLPASMFKTPPVPSSSKSASAASPLLEPPYRSTNRAVQQFV